MTTANGNINALYTQQRMLFMSLDPVHVGAGGYRLGRVDMTITREPGTGLPKIPGTSLAGATRHYASMRYGKPEAAGQHKNFKGKWADCPIIYTFGTATDASGKQTAGESRNEAGTVSMGDAHILFFPVSSMAGPVWVSTVDSIVDAWGEKSVKLPEENEQAIEPTDELVVTNLNWRKDELNLGWLLFAIKKGLQVDPPQEVKERPEWHAISGRIALVSPKLFSQIVNSNLEVRTSVSINPETGAAEEGALFTYEALPRATWLWCDVIEDDYKKDRDGKRQFPRTEKQFKSENGNDAENAGEPLGETWTRPLDVVNAGVKLIEYLGIGGMGTRGFGRMRCVADWEVR
jgi:CRISPR-associated protein Cmr4